MDVNMGHITTVSTVINALIAAIAILTLSVAVSVDLPSHRTSHDMQRYSFETQVTSSR
jgi:hypothetical protein